MTCEQGKPDLQLEYWVWVMVPHSSLGESYGGLSPSQVVAELIPHHGGSVAGRAHQDPSLQAANLAALTEIAQR